MNNLIKKQYFVKSLVAAGIAIAITPSYSAIAQDEVKDIEIISVTGMRSSIQESTRLKRDASGVVDAISAEDIGKFPDTNLAESLQRITGVSIDRENGEGARVTIRGFGPSFNLVTLNGRSMPTAAGGGSSASSGEGRSFDFGNLASESVKSVEVYKTGKANVSSGGIGGTININTLKPLDHEGTKFSFGAKAVHDTTNRVGDDVTPELSGLFSWTNDESTFGMSLTASHQVRHNGTVGAYVTDWRTSVWDGTVPNTPQSAADGAPIVLNNAPEIGQLHALPSDIRYTISDRERTRDNAQLTLQYSPTDKLVATLDYTYSENEYFEARAEHSIWMDSFKTDFTFDDESTATPVIYNEDRRHQQPRDVANALNEYNYINKNESLGINLSYDLTDEFVVTFDAHNSTAKRTPNASYGNSLTTGINAQVAKTQGAVYNDGLPLIVLGFDDCERTNLNCNGILDETDFGTSMLRRFQETHETEITQFRLDGEYELDEGSINFGIERREMESHEIEKTLLEEMGGWGVANPGELQDDFLEPIDYADLFEDYSTQGSWTQGYTGSASVIGAWAANKYDFGFGNIEDESVNRLITEDVTSLYASLNLSGELNSMPYTIVMGLRYERTDTNSTANIAIPTAVRWDSDNDFTVIPGSDNSKVDFAKGGSYSHLLPSFDFSLNVTDDLITRVSYSKTIARPDYGNLSSAVSINSGPTAPTLVGGLPGEASGGNPELVPYESDNLDLSVEWYFDDTSYASIGYYQKIVSNFIGNEPSLQSQYGLRDPSAGPRALQAISELDALGITVTDTTLFSMMAANQLGVDYFSQTEDEFLQAVDIFATAEDPLMMFETNQPVNNEEAKINGFEIAVQHFFGESGFGIQANLTTVNGDVEYDITLDPSESQFSLTGLSDTANLVLMYEKEDWSARLTYNWRDEFLSDTRGQDPVFTEEYQQIDFSVSYTVNDNLSISFDGLNITGENYRKFARSNVQLWNLEESDARYVLGARYTF
ncbi:TonB-dependent receptor [Pseudocolwellia sp. HL-MZ7]|uniref:TonB-dependent receptor n=1 Tax=Pseudocolwellia sp. HL-MZ7 TaxID=3400627 RepID=UPI003CEFC91C